MIKKFLAPKPLPPVPPPKAQPLSDFIQDIKSTYKPTPEEIKRDQEWGVAGPESNAY